MASDPGDDAQTRAEKRKQDLNRRRQLPGERAVALLFLGLFHDATWYLQGGGQFPDGLPPYAHSPYYLTLFSEVLTALQTKRAREERDALALARMCATAP